MATLVTPNLDEVRTLLGRPVTSLDEMRTAGRELAARYGRAFLIKGGHLRLDPAMDLLCTPDGAEQEFSAPFVRGISTHGTGCTYAAAITAGLARGLPLPEAIGEAKRYLANAVGQFLRWTQEGRTTDALHHFAPHT
jgi:hydroxymethylpyrimidine/phosphomethylpyrimidine kinase